MSKRRQNSATPRHGPGPVRGPTDRPGPTADARRPAPAGRRGLLVAVALGLALATAAAYWQLARHDFVNYDDPEYVTDNYQVLRGLTAEGLRWVWTATEAANWHPLTWLSHMLDVTLFGPDPGAHHLVNLALHVANTLLLFFLLRRMTRALWRSAFVAALFALHPLHVESVAWVAERKDMLCALFFFLTLWAYAAWAEKRGTWRYALALALFALGLMTKPMLVTVPFVLLLLDVWPLGRWRGLATGAGASLSSYKGGPCLPGPGEGESPQALPAGASAARLIVEKIPFFVLAAASSIITFIVQRAGGAMTMSSVVPFGQRLANAVVAYGAYLWKTVWPQSLSPFYPYRIPVAAPAVVAALALLAGATVLAVWAFRRRPYAAVGWFWYLGMLVPVIGLVQVGEQALADRYTYLPLVGVFVVVAWGAADLPRPGRPRTGRQAGLAAARRLGGLTLGAPAAIVLLLCLATTYRQTEYWHDSATLWSHALRVNPQNHAAHINLGTVLEEQGRPDEAEKHYREVIRFRPDDPQANNNLGFILARQEKLDEAETYYLRALKGDPKLPEAHNNLGLLLARRGQYDRAIGEYHEALRLKPGLVKAHNNLGLALAAKNDFGAAIEEYREALRLKPDFAIAERNLAGVLLLAGRPAEAVQHARRAVQLEPGNGELRFNLGLALTAAGNLQEAAAAYREALRLVPEDFWAAYRLAWLLAAAEDQQLRDGSQALALARQLCETTAFGDPLMLDLLAAAQAESGNFDEAVRLAGQAAELARAGGRVRLAADIQGRLELYRERRPCRALPETVE